MKSGQTLVVLLVFMMVAIIVVTASIILAISNVQASGRQVLSWEAYDVAESGAENALMNLLRNPTYTAAGETLTVGDGVATIVVTGMGNKTVTSTGRLGNYVRTIEVTAAFSGGKMFVTAWRETFP